MQISLKTIAVFLLALLLVGCGRQLSDTETTAPSDQEVTQQTEAGAFGTPSVTPNPFLPTQNEDLATEPNRTTDPVTQPTETSETSQTEQPAVPEQPEETVVPTQPVQTTQPTEPEITQTTQPSEPVYLTFEQYKAMDAEAQAAYYNTFPDMMSFFDWYNHAKEAYETAHPDIIVGKDPVDIPD